MATTTPTRARISAADRRELVVRAAARLFATRGYGGTRLDDVAAAAGVTKPMVYRHFASKKALYMALLEKHEADLPTFLERPAGAGGGEPRVRAILELWLDYVRENQHAWLMLFRDSSGDEEIQALRQRVTRRAREVMAAFVATRAGDRIPPEQVEPTAELLRTGLAGLALWWIDHPDVPQEVVVEASVRFAATVLA